jgi:O-antigen/teichoic acid export membrane protein
MVRFLAIGCVTVLPVVVVLIAALGWLLPLLFGHAFRGAVPAGRILLAASLLQALRRVAAEGQRGLGSGWAATCAELAFIAVFVGTLVPLTDSDGAKGAALALLIASATAIAVLAAVTHGRRDGRPRDAGRREGDPSQTVLLDTIEPPQPS